MQNETIPSLVTLELDKLAPIEAFRLISGKATSLDAFSDETLKAAATVYRKLGLEDTAVTCYRIIETRTPKNATKHELAKALYASGNAKAALEKLDEIKTSILTERGEKLYTQDRATFLQGAGRADEAYAMLLQYSEQLAEPDLNTTLKLAELERLSGRVDEAYKRLSTHASVFGKSPAYLHALSRTLGEKNQTEQALLFAGILCAENAPATNYLVNYIELLWQSNAIDQLESILQRALRLKMMHPSLLKSVREKGHALNEIAALVPQFEQIVNEGYRTVKPDQLLNYAERFFALELFAEARSAATAAIRQFPLSPSAYYIRGASAFYLDDYEFAEKDLLRCVELNPSYFQAYGILLNVSPRRIDGVKHLAALLAKRNASHWKYSAYGPDGRRGLLDIESSQLCFMQGDFMMGQKLRLERPLCRYLERHYPEQYNCFETPDFPEKKKHSLLVIAEDGVGDEVRYAQYFPMLLQHYKSVEVVCEPRILTLFERSFPKIRFYPFKRRLMERAEQAETNPSANVPFFPLARIIDETIYNKLTTYSEVRLTTDVVRGAWAQLPDRQPLPEGPDDTAFLVADSARVAHWENTLSASAGSKLKVGLLWQSSFVTPRRKKHYLELRNLAPLLATKGVQFYSLQSEHTPEDMALCRQFGIEVFEDIDLHDDFEAVAALTQALDLVVGVNSFTAEMAAAVGTPCWLLGAYNNLVRYRLGESEGEADRLSPNISIIRVDRDEGFIGRDADMQRKTAKLAAQRLAKLANKKA